MNISMKKNKFKWWMSVHVALWSITSPKRVKMFHYGIEQGFGSHSAYWSARVMRKDMLEFIVGKN